jgi:mono/diheme cytochrome c family protein
VQTIKIVTIMIGTVVWMLACSNTQQPPRFVIADSKTYEASLFRQNCTICHGREADGQTLPDGKVIPSLRTTPYKYATDEEIYRHIADGGNGMVPFRNILTDSEIKQLVGFVRKNLRGQ